MGEESRSFLAKLGLNTQGFTKGVNEIKAELTELNSELLKNKRAQKEHEEHLKSLTKRQKEAANAVGTESKEYNDLQASIDKATLELAQLKTEEQNLKSQVKETNAELQKQSDATGKSAEAFKNVGNVLKTAAQFTATAVAGMFTYTTQITATAGEIDDLAKQTGLTVEEVQKLMYAAELSGTSYDTITGAMAKLTKNMSTAKDGTGEAADAFKTLKVDVADSTGVLRDNQDVFDEVIAKLGKIEDETQRDAYAMAIFGKSAQDLNPLILGGTEQLKAFGDELEREGLLLSQTELDKLNEFDDKWVQFQSKLQAGLMGTGSEAVDAFDELFEMSDEIIDFVATLVTGFAKASGFVVEHKEAVLALVSAYGAFKAAMSVTSLIESVIFALKSLKKANEAATVAQNAQNAAAKAHPYLVLASALISLIGGLVSYNAVATKSIDDITSGTDRLRESITSAVATAQSEVELIKNKANRYEELRKKLNRTVQEERELYEIASDLEASYPNQIELIGDTAGAYKELGDQVSNLTEKMLEQARTQASLDALQQAYADRFTYASELYNNAMEAINSSDSENKEAFKDNFEKAWDELVSSNYNFANLPQEYQLVIGTAGGAGVDILNAYLTHKNEDKFFLDPTKLTPSASESATERLKLLMTLTDNQKFINNLERDYSSLLDDSTKSTGDFKEETENLLAVFTELGEKTNVVSKAEKEFANTNELSKETLDAIATAYPAVQDEINDYINNIGTAEDVINHLSIAYQNDVANNKDALQAKLNTDSEYYSKLKEMNDSAINDLANEYGIDLSNYESYTEARLAIESEFLSSKAKNWAKYYDLESKVYYAGPQPADINTQLELFETKMAVQALEGISSQLDADLTDYSKWYTPQLVGSDLGSTNLGTEAGSTASSSSTKKEISIYDKAKEAFKKLVEDRIAEIQRLTDAENNATDERIAAIEKEIAAREKLKDTTDLQERIDFIKGQLKYSQLEDFERFELQRQLASLEDEQKEQAWLEIKNAEIKELEAQKTAKEQETAALVEQLKANQNYANTLFTDLNNGYKSVSSIINNNTQKANINIVTDALSQGQVEQAIKDALGLGMIF